MNPVDGVKRPSPSSAAGLPRNVQVTNGKPSSGDENYASNAEMADKARGLPADFDHIDFEAGKKEERRDAKSG
jgi:hypothetical protein